MRRALWFLLISIVVVAAAWYISGLPGIVSLSIGRFTVETTSAMATLAAIVLAFVAYLLVRLLFGLVLLPRKWRQWRLDRSRGKGDVAIGRALTAIAAGEKRAASETAGRARRLLGDTPQTLLLAAEAARMAGRDEEAAITYRLMLERDDSRFLGLRGLFRAAMAREDWPEATRLAKEAEIAHPGGTWLREARLHLAARTNDWASTLPLAGADAPLAALGTAAAQVETNPERARALAERAWKSDNSFAPAALTHARLQRESGREGRALDTLRTAWKAAPNPELAELALAPVTDPLQRLKAATAFVQVNPDHPESHFLLARAALEAGLTGEARRHADGARRTGMAQRRFYLFLAELEDASRHPEAARAAIRDAATADLDPVWRCDSCGAQHVHWHAACPNCHVPGRLIWTTPRSSGPRGPGQALIASGLDVPALPR
jgi:HemY protein